MDNYNKSRLNMYAYLMKLKDINDFHIINNKEFVILDDINDNLDLSESRFNFGIMILENKYINAIFYDTNKKIFERFNIYGNKLPNNRDINAKLEDICDTFGMRYINVNTKDILNLMKHNNSYFGFPNVDFYMSLWYIKYRIDNIKLSPEKVKLNISKIKNKTHNNIISMLYDIGNEVLRSKYDYLDMMRDTALSVAISNSLMILYNEYRDMKYVELHNSIKEWIDMYEDNILSL